jgi:hypothetical protein
VADPQSTQGFNRYSYVYNNPLTYSDPSGFICSNPGGIEVCFGAVASAVVFFADSIFGSTTVKLPPPNWCGIAGPKGCYGSVPSVLGRIIKDIYGLPSFPNRLTPGFGAETGWMLNFQDSANAGGSAGFGGDWGQVAHEGALILVPGYDLGTCISRGGCSRGEWILAGIGVIPGGKSASLGAKGLSRSLKRLVGRSGRDVPNATGPVHHICTNKNCVSTVRGGPWTPRFEAIFEKAGMNLDDALYKVRVPGHAGPHPEAYHRAVYDRLINATDGLSGGAYKSALQRELQAVGQEAATSGSMLNNLLVKP